MSCASRALHGDELALRCGCASCVPRAGMAGILPRFITPGDVDILKIEVRADYARVDAAIRSCAAMSAAERVSWGSDFAAWQAWDSAESSWWHAVQQYETGQRLQEIARKWQKRIEGRQCDAGPEIAPPDKAATATDILDTVKTVAVVTAVIGGVVVLTPIVYDWVAGRRLARRARAR